MSWLAICTCDVCSGPAWWCLDKFGDVWIRCQDDKCLFNLQEDLFPQEPDWGDRGTHSVSGDEPDDSDRSISTKNPTKEVLNDVELPF